MYLFAHLGLGYLSVKPWWRSVPVWPLLFGAILPDLIDKPLYYAFAWSTGRHGEAIGLISGTRTFGHTLLFFLVCCAFALWKRSPSLAALSAGILSHLFLDCLGVAIASRGETLLIQSLLFPLNGWEFPAMVYSNVGDQLGHWFHPEQLVFEVLGLVVLIGLVRRTISGRRVFRT